MQRADRARARLRGAAAASGSPSRSFPGYGGLSGQRPDAVQPSAENEERQARPARLRAVEGRQARRADLARPRGGRGGRAGTSSAASMAAKYLGERSTSTAAASTWCSRTTRTSGPRRSRLRGASDFDEPRRAAEMARYWMHGGLLTSSAARRCRSRSATSSCVDDVLASTCGRRRCATTCSPRTTGRRSSTAPMRWPRRRRRTSGSRASAAASSAVARRRTADEPTRRVGRTSRRRWTTTWPSRARSPSCSSRRHGRQQGRRRRPRRLRGVVRRMLAVLGLDPVSQWPDPRRRPPAGRRTPLWPSRWSGAPGPRGQGLRDLRRDPRPARRGRACWSRTPPAASDGSWRADARRTQGHRWPRPPQARGQGTHPAARRCGPGHPAQRQARARRRRDDGRPAHAPGATGRPAPRVRRRGRGIVIGRNPVIEALRAAVPGHGLLRAIGTENDPRDDRGGEARRAPRGMPVADVRPRRAGPPHRRRPAPGARARRAALRLRPPRGPAPRIPRDRDAAARGARRRHRPAQPRLGRPLGGRFRRARGR